MIKANSKHANPKMLYHQGGVGALLKQRVPIKLCEVCSDTKEHFSDCQKVLWAQSFLLPFNDNVKCCDNMES